MVVSLGTSPTASAGSSSGSSRSCPRTSRCCGRPAPPTSPGWASTPAPHVPAAELRAAIERADVVVSHAGTGAALAALEAGQVPDPRAPAGEPRTSTSTTTSCRSRWTSRCATSPSCATSRTSSTTTCCWRLPGRSCGGRTCRDCPSPGSRTRRSRCRRPDEAEGGARGGRGNSDQHGRHEPTQEHLRRRRRHRRGGAGVAPHRPRPADHPGVTPGRQRHPGAAAHPERLRCRRGRRRRHGDRLADHRPRHLGGHHPARRPSTTRWSARCSTSTCSSASVLPRATFVFADPLAVLLGQPHGGARHRRCCRASACSAPRATCTRPCCDARCSSPGWRSSTSPRRSSAGSWGSRSRSPAAASGRSSPG